MSSSAAVMSPAAANLHLRIIEDVAGLNPRTSGENWGVMLCFQGQYPLGDRSASRGLREEGFAGWQVLIDRLTHEYGSVTALPIYLLDQGGLSVSTEPFPADARSSQVGIIFAAHEACSTRLSAIQSAEPIAVQVAAHLRDEVATYDDYLAGRCVRFTVESAPRGLPAARSTTVRAGAGILYRSNEHGARAILEAVADLGFSQDDVVTAFSRIEPA